MPMPSNGKGWIRESMRVCLMDRLFTFSIRFARWAGAERSISFTIEPQQARRPNATGRSPATTGEAIASGRSPAQPGFLSHITRELPRSALERKAGFG
jgi:hypothetical protein